MPTYRIGEVAELTGVSVDALRYYERMGLLKAPPRTQGGFRRYPSEVVQRIGFIKQSQALGLALGDIQELLDEHHGHSACRRVHKLLLKRLAEIDARMTELAELRGTLDAYRRSCEKALRGAAQPSCPMLQELDARQ
jgi:MerR family transcriptional regulator, mercuric resistance operon regulatory protein